MCLAGQLFKYSVSRVQLNLMSLANLARNAVQCSFVCIAPNWVYLPDTIMVHSILLILHYLLVKDFPTLQTRDVFFNTLQKRCLFSTIPTTR